VSGTREIVSRRVFALVLVCVCERARALKISLHPFFSRSVTAPRDGAVLRSFCRVYQ
jgi:hypothetical protein